MIDIWYVLAGRPNGCVCHSELWGLQEPTSVFSTYRLKNLCMSCLLLSWYKRVWAAYWANGPWASFLFLLNGLGNLPLHSEVFTALYVHQWYLFYEAFSNFCPMNDVCVLYEPHWKRVWTALLCLISVLWLLIRWLHFLKSGTMSHLYSSPTALCTEWIENGG